MRTTRFVVAVTILMSLVDVAHAHAPRCTSDAITLGDSESTVEAQCGEPAEKRSYCAARLDIDRPGTTLQPSINTPCVNLDQQTLSIGLGTIADDAALRIGAARHDRRRSLGDDAEPALNTSDDLSSTTWDRR